MVSAIFRIIISTPRNFWYTIGRSMGIGYVIKEAHVFWNDSYRLTEVTEHFIDIRVVSIFESTNHNQPLRFSIHPNGIILECLERERRGVSLLGTNTNFDNIPSKHLLTC